MGRAGYLSAIVIPIGQLPKSAEAENVPTRKRSSPKDCKILSIILVGVAQRKMRSKTMKKTTATKSRKNVEEMSAEYKFDYKKARPNRFANRMKDGPLVVVLDR